MWPSYWLSMVSGPPMLELIFLQGWLIALLGLPMSLVLLELKQLSYKRFHKHKSFGVSGKLFYHISSFLSGKSFEVVLDGKSSSQQVTNAGVPKGLIFGRMLLLLYITIFLMILFVKLLFLQIVLLFTKNIAKSLT